MEANFAQWVASQHEGRGSVPSPEAIPKVLRTGNIHVVFQPLVDLYTEQTYAYEALLRSTSPDFKSPTTLFEEAVAAGCVGALGRCVREIAVKGCSTWPLFLNVHPHEFNQGWLVRPDDPIFQHEQPVFLEITETVPLSHFHYCQSLLKEVRSKGIFLAVDDLGAGYSNLRYIADLSPEVVKLDRSLISGIQKDPRRLKLVRSIVRLCTDLGANVVAEGLEHVEEVMAVRDTGARFGQGFVLARPSFPPPRCDDRAFTPVPAQELVL